MSFAVPVELVRLREWVERLEEPVQEAELLEQKPVVVFRLDMV